MESSGHGSQNRGAQLVSVAFALGLVVTTAAGATSQSIASGAFAVAASAFCGVSTWFLLTSGAIPAAILAILYALAYVPSSWDAIALGFPRTYLRVTPEGLRWALVSFLVQIGVTAVAGWWGGKSVLGRAACKTVLRAVDPPKSSRGFALAFLTLLALTFVSSIKDGQWTSYAPGRHTFDEMSLAGGFRLALFYSTWLLGACALVGSKIGQATTTNERRRWWAIAGVVFLLIYVLQGRRLMLSGAGFLVLPLLVSVDKSRFLSVRKRIVALLSVGAVLSGLFYMSLVWRVALHHRSDNTVEHLRGMADARVGANEAVENVRERLNYLWMDSVAMGMGGRIGSVRLIEQTLMTQIVGNIPGSLYPDKYKWKTMNCEILLVGGAGDLPCTAFGEGVLLGGRFGLAIVAIGWFIAVAIGSALYATGTHSGRVMGAVFMMPLTLIETQAFPILACIRALIITAAILGPMAWITSTLIKAFRPPPRDPQLEGASAPASPASTD